MKNKLLPFVAVLLLLPTACSTDKDYDNLTQSDGIDFTMKVAKGFTLPFGSTSPIYLTEMMDSSKIEQLSIDPDGRFFITQSGAFSETSVQVKDLSLSVRPEISLRKYNLTVDQETLPEEVQQQLLKLKVGDDLSSLKQVVINIVQEEIDFTDHSSFTLHRTNIDPAVLSIEKVQLKEVSKISIDVKIDNLPKQKKDVQAVDFTVDLPSFVVVEGESQPGSFVVANKSFENTDVTTVAWTEDFYVTALDFTRDQQGALVPKNGSIDCAGRLNVHGKVCLLNLQVTGADLIISKNALGKKVVELKKPITINVAPKLQIPDMQLGEAQGTFNPAVLPISTSFGIDLGADMDFLTNDNASIDIDNPEIKLNIKNDAAVNILADILVKADNDKEVRFSDVNLTTAGGESHVLLNSDNVDTGYDLHTFLSPLPKMVTVAVDPHANTEATSTIGLGEKYVIGGTFDVLIPMAFRSISFKYDQTIADVWGSDRSEITSKLASLSGIQLKMKVGNTIPLDMKVTVVGTNVKTGLEDPDVLLCNFSQTIPAGSLEKETESDLIVTLDIPDTSKLGSMIIRFEGVGEGLEINAKQYIRIMDSSIVLSDGINVNMN